MRASTRYLVLNDADLKDERDAEQPCATLWQVQRIAAMPAAWAVIVAIPALEDLHLVTCYAPEPQAPQAKHMHLRTALRSLVVLGGARPFRPAILSWHPHCLACTS